MSVQKTPVLYSGSMGMESLKLKKPVEDARFQKTAAQFLGDVFDTATRFLEGKQTVLKQGTSLTRWKEDRGRTIAEWLPHVGDTNENGFLDIEWLNLAGALEVYYPGVIEPVDVIRLQDVGAYTFNGLLDKRAVEPDSPISSSKRAKILQRIPRAVRKDPYNLAAVGEYLNHLYGGPKPLQESDFKNIASFLADYLGIYFTHAGFEAGPFAEINPSSELTDFIRDSHGRMLVNCGFYASLTEAILSRISGHRYGQTLPKFDIYSATVNAIDNHALTVAVYLSPSDEKLNFIASDNNTIDTFTSENAQGRVEKTIEKYVRHAWTARYRDGGKFDVVVRPSEMGNEFYDTGTENSVSTREWPQNSGINVLAPFFGRGVSLSMPPDDRVWQGDVDINGSKYMASTKRLGNYGVFFRVAPAGVNPMDGKKPWVYFGLYDPWLKKTVFQIPAYYYMPDSELEEIAESFGQMIVGGSFQYPGHSSGLGQIFSDSRDKKMVAAAFGDFLKIIKQRNTKFGSGEFDVSLFSNPVFNKEEFEGFLTRLNGIPLGGISYYDPPNLSDAAAGALFDVGMKLTGEGKERDIRAGTRYLLLFLRDFSSKFESGNRGNTDRFAAALARICRITNATGDMEVFKDILRERIVGSLHTAERGLYADALLKEWEQAGPEPHLIRRLKEKPWKSMSPEESNLLGGYVLLLKIVAENFPEPVRGTAKREFDGLIPAAWRLFLGRYYSDSQRESLELNRQVYDTFKKMEPGLGREEANDILTEIAVSFLQNIAPMFGGLSFQYESDEEVVAETMPYLKDMSNRLGGDPVTSERRFLRALLLLVQRGEKPIDIPLYKELVRSGLLKFFTGEIEVSYGQEAANFLLYTPRLWSGEAAKAFLKDIEKLPMSDDVMGYYRFIRYAEQIAENTAISDSDIIEALDLFRRRPKTDWEKFNAEMLGGPFSHAKWRPSLRRPILEMALQPEPGQIAAPPPENLQSRATNPSSARNYYGRKIISDVAAMLCSGDVISEDHSCADVASSLADNILSGIGEAATYAREGKTFLAGASLDKVTNSLNILSEYPLLRREFPQSYLAEIAATLTPLLSVDNRRVRDYAQILAQSFVITSQDIYPSLDMAGLTQALKKVQASGQIPIRPVMTYEALQEIITQDPRHDRRALAAGAVKYLLINREVLRSLNGKKVSQTAMPRGIDVLLSIAVRDTSNNVRRESERSRSYVEQVARSHTAVVRQDGEDDLPSFEAQFDTSDLSKIVPVVLGGRQDVEYVSGVLEQVNSFNSQFPYRSHANYFHAIEFADGGSGGEEGPVKVIHDYPDPNDLSSAYYSLRLNPRSTFEDVAAAMSVPAFEGAHESLQEAFRRVHNSSMRSSPVSPDALDDFRELWTGWLKDSRALWAGAWQKAKNGRVLPLAKLLIALQIMTYPDQPLYAFKNYQKEELLPSKRRPELSGQFEEITIGGETFVLADISRRIFAWNQ